jgi:DNA-binding MarR family transcriptional regulator
MIKASGKQPAAAKTNTGPGLFVVNLEEIDARTFILFVQAAEVVLKYSDAALYRAGSSLVKLMVLQVLQSHGGTLTPTRIAALTVREKHNITTLIRRMQRDGLIKVAKDKKDKRSINVTITAKGKQSIIDTIPAARKIVKQVMAPIPESSALVLDRLLKRIRQSAYEGLKQLDQD